MKRINYIIGICILAASLITAATQGGDVFDGWKKLTKAGEEEVQPPHKHPNAYWRFWGKGNGSLNVVVEEPEPFKVVSGEPLIIDTVEIGEQQSCDLDLSQIPDSAYTYYCVYRESANRSDSIGRIVSSTYSNDTVNTQMRPYQDHDYCIWYYVDTYVDLTKNKNTYTATNILGPDTFILEVSTKDNYKCVYANPDNNGNVVVGQTGGFFYKPSEVTRYKVVVEDTRVLKHPRQYWNDLSKVNVMYPESEVAESSKDTTVTGKFSLNINPFENTKDDKLGNYDYACLVIDDNISFEGLTTAGGNGAPREYKTKDGKKIAVWYRTTTKDTLNISFKVGSTVGTDPDTTVCDLYYGKGLLKVGDNIQQAASILDISKMANVKKYTYTIYQKPLDKSLVIIDENNIRHEKVDTLYALPGEKIKIYQQANSLEGISGYIAWHSPEKDYLWYKNHIDFADGGFQYYHNGVAFYKTKASNGTTPMPVSLCYIYYTADERMEKDEEVTLYWDASSMLGAKEVTDAEGNITLFPPSQVTIRHKYIIKHAENSSDRLQKALEERRQSSSSTDTELLNKAGFFEQFEIHTPYNENGSNTSFRLVEPLYNYYIPSGTFNGDVDYQACANAVLWKVYDASGNPAEFLGPDGTFVTELMQWKKGWGDVTGGGTVEWPNIFFCQGLGKDAATAKGTLQQKQFYITAEVGRKKDEYTDVDKWYPVSLLTVYLEPFADFKTERELKAAAESPLDNNYKARYQSVIERDYVLLNSITFDAPPNGEVDYTPLIGLKGDAEKNYRSSTLLPDASEYAVSASFAYDGVPGVEGVGRASGARGVYRGEYALFKTLNVQGVSDKNAKYFDWFAQATKNGKEGGDYFVKVHDRHYEHNKIHSGNESEMGFFMYVDATEIPGVIVKLPVDSGALCQGTRLLVTAWVCNLQSKSEGSIAADLGFTFKGITEKENEEREETILNKFYTGTARQVPDTATVSQSATESNPLEAEWQQVYFYFTIKPGEATYNSYLLEIANNCRHSNGADFAVDDIRVYKMNPELYVEREEACDENDLVVRTGYEHILGVYGKTAESSDETKVDPDQDSWMKQLLHLGLRDHEFNVYYSFTDEYKFNARADSVHWLFLDYNNNGDRASHGRVVVSTKKDYYNAWNNINDSDLIDTHLYEESRRRKLKAILDYKGLYERYSKTDKPNTVLTPAELAEKAKELDIIDDLYNSNPIDTATIIKHEKFIELSKYFFTSLGMTPIQLSWQTVADKSRGVISLAHVTKTVDAPEQTQADGEGTESEIDHENDKLEEGTQYHVGLFKDEDFYLNNGLVRMDECFPVADFKVSYNGLSIFVDTETEIDDAFICSFSSVNLSAKLKFNYQGKEDSLTGKDVPIDWYVGTMKDKTYTDLTGTSVSLEAALDAFHEQCGESKDFRGTVADLKDMIDFEYKDYLLKLCNDSLLYLDENGFYFSVTDTRRDIVAIPNRRAIEYGSTYSYVICTEPEDFTIKVNENVPEAWLGLDEIDYEEGFQPAIRLGLKDIENSREEELTIPIRKVVFSPKEEEELKKVDHLGFAREVGKDFYDIIFTGESTDSEWKNAGQVAVLESIVAYKDEREEELLTLRFIDFTNDQDSRLHGLTFREGFEYELQVRFHEYDVENNYLQEFCDGFINFKIKIVPEYVTWAGSEDSRNWNNDANWRRATFEELYKKEEDPNGTHTESFSPMAFTKVMIPQEGKNPILLDTKWEEDVTPFTIKDLEEEGNSATDNIELDLMVDRDDLIAKRFYANTCDEIYFKPNATLMSQQYLTYDTARVEFEMEKDQWYLLSSPLKGVVAGDMYSPKTDSGRQVTDAFAPIVFDPNKNNRFAPAYYQRKWDNTAVLYFRNEGQNPDPDTHDSYISANWSTEYNDAEVFYTPGSGFSVHVENLPDNGTTSLVRLPKGDTSYDYYSNGESTPEKPNTQSITRGDNYGQLSLGKDEKTITVNLENQTDANKYFLAGNPFMTYLNMEVFLKENNLGSTYWLLNEKGETVVTRVSEEGILSNMQEATAGCVAPMQGFFVFREEPVTKVVAIEGLKYSTDMMLADNISSEEEAMTKSVPLSVVPSLYIEAERSGRKSSLSLIQREKAEVGYKKEEDVAILLNVNHPATPIVYSIAGTQATCINVIPEMANIPLGVYSEDESDVTLRFAGLEHFGDSLYLYDALKNEEILIDSRNAEVTVPGATHGRYFLNVSRSIQVESQIRVYTPMPGQVVVASTAGDLLKSVRVYDLSGKVVSIFDHLSTTVHQFSLPTGFYIVCAESESCTEKSKISVR